MSGTNAGHVAQSILDLFGVGRPRLHAIDNVSGEVALRAVAIVIGIRGAAGLEHPCIETFGQDIWDVGIYRWC